MMVPTAFCCYRTRAKDAKLLCSNHWHGPNQRPGYIRQPGERCGRAFAVRLTCKSDILIESFSIPKYLLRARPDRIYLYE